MGKYNTITDYFYTAQYKINPLALKTQFEKMVLRWIARWAKNRGYWPSATELAISKCRKLRKNLVTKKEWVRAKHAFENVCWDLVGMGDLEVQNPQFLCLALTEQGWTKVPAHYERIDPPHDPLYKRRVRTAKQLLQHAERLKKHAYKLIADEK